MASAILNEPVVAGNGSQGIMPVLSLVNGKPRASSLAIAEHFKKRHDNVLRMVTQTRHNLPKEFDALNFEAVEYTDPKGENRPFYLMTRDGFALIVMSFTGKEAMAWKLRYIEAFNAMEAELAGQQSAPPAPLASLTPSQQQELQNIVAAKSSAFPKEALGRVRAQLWSRLHNKFKVAKYDQLPAAAFPEAVEYLVGLAVRGAYPEALPEAPAEAPKAPTAIKALPGRRRITELDRADIARRLGLLKQRTNSLILEYFEFTRELHQPFNDVACDKDNYDHDAAGMMTAVNYGLQYFNRVACGNLETLQSLADFAFHATTAFRKVEHLPASGTGR